MKTFRMYLTEAITRTDVEKLRADAGAFTKNIRRISSGAELARVAEAFRVWREYAETFVYNRLLGLHDAYDFKNEPYLNRQVREKASPISSLATFNDIFLVRNHHRYIPSEQLRVGREYAYNEKTSPFWNSLYREFDRNRSKLYATYSKRVRDGFKAIDDYIAQKDVHPDQALTHTENIDGVAVTIISSEAKEIDADPRITLKHLKTVFAALKAKGLARALARLTITIYTSNTDFDKAAGTYGGMHVDINALGANVHTIAHEIGHHFFFAIMSRERQDAWTNFVKRKKLFFTDDEFADIYRAYLRAFEADTSGYYTTHRIWETIPKYLSGITLAKYKHFMIDFGKTSRKRILLDPFKDKSDLDSKFNEFKQQASYGFMMFAPSAYSNKNTDEAFAEVFAEYVIDEHPLADLVRATFEEVTGLK